jgi:hypothetical protein
VLAWNNVVPGGAAMEQQLTGGRRMD